MDARLERTILFIILIIDAMSDTKAFGRFTFSNNVVTYRAGFSHTSKLYVDGKYLTTETCEYLNRTWEAYDYQTVMKKVVKLALEATNDTALVKDLNALLLKL
jgi:hypothetical protein